ncbi:MAG: hypothetical protein AAFW84_25430 [Cyanobacteria bacterium J06635_15]
MQIRQPESLMVHFQGHDAMLFDRILEDSLGFIRQTLWSREGEATTNQPFQITKSIDGEFGFIHLLDGRDTPRAVRTWMYSPRRQKLNSAKMVVVSTPMDLHIYMDFLGPLRDTQTPKAIEKKKEITEKRQRGISINTHRLQILKASHFLNADGFYDCELVFWQDIDCYPFPHLNLPKGITAKAIATKVADTLAFQCLDIAAPLKMKTEAWEAVACETMGMVQSNLRAAS